MFLFSILDFALVASFQDSLLGRRKIACRRRHPPFVRPDTGCSANRVCIHVGNST